MPQHDQPTASNIGMFYLHVHLQNDRRCHWVAMLPNGPFVSLKFMPSAALADAFTMTELNTITGVIRATHPNAELIPVECNNEVLTRQQRKLINAE